MKKYFTIHSIRNRCSCGIASGVKLGALRYEYNGKDAFYCDGVCTCEDFGNGRFWEMY